MTARKEKWAAWSGVVAVISLVAALVFNGLQVRDSANAQRQAKITTELSLVAEIQSAMTRHVYSLVPYRQGIDRLREGRRRSYVSRRAYRLVAEEAYNLNYVAWLFNNKHLSAPEADTLLGPVLICEYNEVIAPVLRAAPSEVPELVRFIQARPRISC